MRTFWATGSWAHAMRPVKKAENACDAFCLRYTALAPFRLDVCNPTIQLRRNLAVLAMYTINEWVRATSGSVKVKARGPLI